MLRVVSAECFVGNVTIIVDVFSEGVIHGTAKWVQRCPKYLDVRDLEVTERLGYSSHLLDCS
jgi:hypothetical protein